MKIVLVTGTRSELSQNEKNCIEDAVFSERPDLIIHGDCPTGVDFWAEILCEIHGWPQIPMPARWRDLGKKAGFIRNNEMVSVCEILFLHGHELVCLGFPRGLEWSGTRHCMQAAAKKRIPVKEFVLKNKVEIGESV